MSYLPALFGTVGAYALLGILLLSLNITSRWRWWVKLGTILLTTVAFIGTYIAITGLLGWPSAQAMPERFSLLSARIIEPDKASGAPGRLFMWAEEVDAENLSIAEPRGYEVVYTVALAQMLREAQQSLLEGDQVLGESLKEPEAAEAATPDMIPGTDDTTSEEADGETEAPIGMGNGQQGIGGGDGYLLDVTDSLRLSDMPPPDMPDKAPL